jgi:hypothetical protein
VTFVPTAPRGTELDNALIAAYFPDGLISDTKGGPMDASRSFLADQTAEVDAFGRLPFAERLAQTIAERADPESIAIGIYGRWGDGKSSVLGFLHRALQQISKKCLVIKFNPWRFRDEETLVQIFFGELLAAIRRAAAKEPSATDKLKELLSNRWVQTSLEFFTGIDSEKIEHALNEELDKTKAKLEDALAALDVKLVFLIDDIDRLDPSEIHAVFRLVKLSASLKRTVFVLAFDYDIVATALGTRFASGGGVEDGRKYIEKIIQVPVELPKIDPADLAKYLLETLETHVRPLESLAIAPGQYGIFKEQLVERLLPRLPTPRMCKRYVNAVQFAAGMLGDSVDGIDLLWLEGLRIGFPPLYAAIRDHKSRFVFDRLSQSNRFEADRQHLVDKELKDLGPVVSTAGRAIVDALFVDDEAKKKPRSISNPTYFPWYFNYTPGNEQSGWNCAVRAIRTIRQNDGNSFVDIVRGALSTEYEADFRSGWNHLTKQGSFEDLAPAISPLLRIAATGDAEHQRAFLSLLDEGQFDKSIRDELLAEAVRTSPTLELALHSAGLRNRSLMQVLRALWGPKDFAHKVVSEVYTLVGGVRLDEISRDLEALRVAFEKLCTNNGVLKQATDEKAVDDFANAWALCGLTDAKWSAEIFSKTHRAGRHNALRSLLVPTFRQVEAPEQIGSFCRWMDVRLSCLDEIANLPGYDYRPTRSDPISFAKWIQDQLKVFEREIADGRVHEFAFPPE